MTKLIELIPNDGQYHAVQIFQKDPERKTNEFGTARKYEFTKSGQNGYHYVKEKTDNWLNNYEVGASVSVIRKVFNGNPYPEFMPSEDITVQSHPPTVQATEEESAVISEHKMAQKTKDASISLQGYAQQLACGLIISGKCVDDFDTKDAEDCVEAAAKLRKAVNNKAAFESL